MTHPSQPNHHAEVVFLGTGTSVGVPVLGCDCDVCQSVNPRNHRMRCAIVLRRGAERLLVDTPPDLRTQLLRERIPLIHAVLFTHEHADHLFGLDDLRLFPFRLGHPVPLYCQRRVEERIRKSFDYAFVERKATHAGSVPQLTFSRIDDDPFEVLGIPVTPIPMKHGPNFDVLGFRFGDFAYCTDTNHIPPSSLERLRGVKTLVLGALRKTPHPTHFNLEQAIEVAHSVGAQQTFLTHLSHDLEYEETSKELPTGVALAYDGLRVVALLDC
ncbi:MBL fold metallo-hydrolase [Novipirellula artificiosorum]|uniref:Phosphoribosyl 1,2-cyclic phosphodiesterase n=1 Tax=Novipirellula artificiosorum TaxID=2528016 RepID=A0A5C6D8X4_9BACT|nr:MBL fold metallo-hydrolase [Novipirellula artificiosorum]TWU33392.1 Phosphoribosyl 1,2-cyclic phosphodiesterase [Novipirellula artificiosorum]